MEMSGSEFFVLCHAIVQIPVLLAVRRFVVALVFPVSCTGSLLVFLDEKA